MTWLVLKSWILLLHFDYVMRFRPFRILHREVRESPMKKFVGPRPEHAVLCHAVDIACVLYFKQVLCLQRSATTTVLLRSYGWDASMMIGATTLPVSFHAWTEIDAVAVNDKPYVRTMYRSLESR
jgi:hypothetical protein